MLLATVLPGLSLAASGATEAGPGDAQVSRLVLRLRPDARPAGNTPLDAARLAELQSVLGQSLAGSAVTSAGNQVIELATPVSAATAKQLVNTLRMRGDIVWAEVERVARPTVAKSSLAAESPSIRRLIVTFADPQWAMASRSNASAGAERDAELSNAAGTPLHVARASVGGAWIVELPVAVDTATARAVAAALQSSGVARLAVPDYRVRPMAVTPDDSFYTSGDQWYLQDKADTGYAGIDAAHAWDITTGSPGMVIAVVDTGIVPHPDLGRVIPGYDFVSDATSANDGDKRDPDPTDPGNWRTTGLCPAPFNTRENSDWHGTMVAGVIAADTNNGIGVAGIDWNARILDVRALGRCGGDFSDILDAMTWSAGLRVPGVPINPNPAKVINLSVGGDGPCDGQIQAMLDEILDAGVFIAVSAGNDSTNSDYAVPASCNGVSTVAATDESGALASYSNFSTSMDISAPGGDGDLSSHDTITTTWNSGTNVARSPNYAATEGTSFSSPMVAGVAALMLAVNPSLTPSQLKALMAQSASPFAAGSSCATQGICGAGILNAYGAVKAAQATLGQATTVPVVEYYHQALDHYFITASTSDISLLDGGAFPGWLRTGQTFRAYPTQSNASLRPVCRFFIPPQHGDSHFFSAANADCAFLLMAAANPASYPNFSGYIEEYAAAFYVALPDATGACPAGTVPVFRLWNQRVDSNHRYTTNAAIVAQMQARNYALEGAAPNFASMCAPP